MDVENTLGVGGQKIVRHFQQETCQDNISGTEVREGFGEGGLPAFVY